jgi:L-asparaginase
MSTELVHIALGGTISMNVVDGLAIPTLTGPKLAQIAGIATTAVDLATVGGPQLTFDLLVRTVEAIRAAQARGVRAVIVTLGTDAIEEVGAFLTYAGPWQANVVITGSMVPGAEPDSDGPQNLRDAAAVASGVELPEPVVVFASHVTLARATVKASGVALDAFTSPGQRAWSVAEALSAGSLPGRGPAMPALGPPGADRVGVPMLISAMSMAGPTDGAPPPAAPGKDLPPALVCLAAGAGNLTHEVWTVAQAALAAGSTVAIATRALDLRMSAAYGYAGGSGAMVAAGAVLASQMTAHRARIYLLIALSQGLRGVDLSSSLARHVDALGMSA